MGKEEEALRLLRQGLSPGEIRLRQDEALETILNYLDIMVGRGQIRRSDILFSVPAERRVRISSALAETQDEEEIIEHLNSQGYEPDPDDVKVVAKYGDARFALGDMYDDIRSIEVTMHDMVRRAFKKEFGETEALWWPEIPLNIRQKCAARQQEDLPVSLEIYRYIDLADLRTIFEKKWSIASQQLPNALRGDKPRFLDDLLKLNNIRKKIMHPVRGEIPSEDDFEFLRSLKNKITLGFELTDISRLAPFIARYCYQELEYAEIPIQQMALEHMQDLGQLFDRYCDNPGTVIAILDRRFKDAGIPLSAEELVVAWCRQERDYIDSLFNDASKMHPHDDPDEPATAKQLWALFLAYKAGRLDIEDLN